MEKHSSDITRRRLMKAAGALAGAAAIGGWSPARAQAGEGIRQSDLVVNTGGGQAEQLRVALRDAV